MPTLDRIRRALAAHQAHTLPLEGKHQAGVAMVLSGDPVAPEVLLIERARKRGDPWSGHMAFPGGRLDPGDPHARATAERETLEEVGLSLGHAARLGRLDDIEGYHAGRPSGLVISAFVYHLESQGCLVPNHEVEMTLWVPLRTLRDPSNHVDYAYAPAGGMRYPGIVVGHPERHVVWGLTYRFLESFFRVVDRPLPERRRRAG